MNVSLNHLYTITLDDDPIVGKVIEKATRMKTVAFEDAQAFLSNPRHYQPVAIFLDIHLGEDKANGIQLLPILRKRFPLVPILILTSDVRDEVLVQALEAGASDFIRKPVKASEVSSRLNTRLRDASEMEKRSTVRFGELTFDPIRGRLRCRGQEVRLSASNSTLLHRLMTAKGTPTPRKVLREELWGTLKVTDNALDRKMSELRKALRTVAPNTELISIYGKGVVLAKKGIADR